MCCDSASARSAPTTSRNSRSDRFAFLSAQPLGRLEDCRTRGVAAVVRSDPLAVRLEGLGLGHGVEATALVELKIDVHERLDSRAEPGTGAPDALGDCANPAVPAGKKRHDPVCFTQFLGTKHYGFISVDRHDPILPRRCGLSGIRRSDR